MVGKENIYYRVANVMNKSETDAFLRLFSPTVKNKFSIVLKDVASEEYINIPAIRTMLRILEVVGCIEHHAINHGVNIVVKSRVDIWKIRTQILNKRCLEENEDKMRRQ